MGIEMREKQGTGRMVFRKDQISLSCDTECGTEGVYTTQRSMDLQYAIGEGDTWLGHPYGPSVAQETTGCLSAMEGRIRASRRQRHVGVAEDPETLCSGSMEPSDRVN